MFLGVIFVVFGVSMILNSLFHIDLPIIRICLAIFVIYIGAKILFGSFGIHLHNRIPEGSVFFRSGEFKFPPQDWANREKAEYNAIFGSSTIDLRGVNLTQGDVYVDIRAVFGEVEILVDPDTPIEVRTQTVFGSAKLPNKESCVFGQFNYQSDAAKNAPHKIVLRTDVVFGSLRFRTP